MGSGAPATLLYKGDEKETATDAEIIKQALAASNGEKFAKLNSAQWSELYPSQSEADFAFINIIAVLHAKPKSNSSYLSCVTIRPATKSQAQRLSRVDG